MEITITQIIEEMQRRAQTCLTASKDATEESLMDEARLRETNEQDAKMWLVRAKVWQEAEQVVRGDFTPEKIN